MTILDHTVSNMTLAEYRADNNCDANSIIGTPMFTNLNPDIDTIAHDLTLQSASNAIGLGQPYGTSDPNDYLVKIDEFLGHWSPTGNPDDAFTDFSIMTVAEQDELRSYLRNASQHDITGKPRDASVDAGAYEYVPGTPTLTPPTAPLNLRIE